MEATTIAIITPIATGLGLIITGAIGWGKLRTRFDSLEKEHVKLTDELHTANGRTTYVTRIECGESQNRIVNEVASLASKIEARDEKWDESWNTIAHHIGRVEEFMRKK